VCRGLRGNQHQKFRMGWPGKARHEIVVADRPIGRRLDVFPARQSHFRRTGGVGQSQSNKSAMLHFGSRPRARISAARSGRRIWAITWRPPAARLAAIAQPMRPSPTKPMLPSRGRRRRCPPSMAGSTSLSMFNTLPSKDVSKYARYWSDAEPTSWVHSEAGGGALPCTPHPPAIASKSYCVTARRAVSRAPMAAPEISGRLPNPAWWALLVGLGGRLRIGGRLVIRRQ
jgi:hypothetical protein